MALYLAIQVGAFLSRLIPRSWRYVIGTAVGDAVFWIWIPGRRRLVENMATILRLQPADPLVRRTALKSMRNYCKYLIEFLELPNLSAEHEVVASMRIDDLQYLTAALESGNGVIIATAHFGTIELGGIRLAELTNFHAVYDTFRPAYLDRLIQRKRREKGIDLISTGDVRRMIRVLRAGEALAILFDKPTDPAKGVPVTFFGRPTAIPAGPALLALKTGAALVPVFLFRQPDRSFYAKVFAPIEMTPTKDRDIALQTVSQRLMSYLESVVRARPDQWYMFRSMWPEGRRPTGVLEASPDLSTTS